jgi:hypothetical protein
VSATATAWNAAEGTTSRSVSLLGVFSGTVDVRLSMSLDPVGKSRLRGTIDIDAPWPCSDQVGNLEVRVDRPPVF